MSKTKKICVITCYKYPDYVRGEVIREAVKLNPEYELISVKNRHKGLLRYFEVLARLVFIRLSKRPDVYILTFRGYEMLPFVRIATIGKKLVFDEFINLIEWTVYEHKKLKAGSFLEKILKNTYSFWLRRAGVILTDTDSHAAYSAKLMEIPLSKYKVLAVGADEKVFTPTQKAVDGKNRFEVLYYGSMLPLHGVDYVIQAAVKLGKTDPKIHFTLIGGKKEIKQKIEEAKSLGANIDYIERVPLKQLPGFIQKSDVCLGGPFGKTIQSDMVITGKTFQFMAMGKPAVIGKNKESRIFKDKYDCIMVNQADADDLAKQISWAVNNKNQLLKISKNGNKLYQDKFSLAKISSRLSDLLK